MNGMCLPFSPGSIFSGYPAFEYFQSVHHCLIADLNMIRQIHLCTIMVKNMRSRQHSNATTFTDLLYCNLKERCRENVRGDAMLYAQAHSHAHAQLYST